MTYHKIQNTATSTLGTVDFSWKLLIQMHSWKAKMLLILRMDWWLVGRSQILSLFFASRSAHCQILLRKRGDLPPSKTTWRTVPCTNINVTRVKDKWYGTTSVKKAKHQHSALNSSTVGRRYVAKRKLIWKSPHSTMQRPGKECGPLGRCRIVGLTNLCCRLLKPPAIYSALWATNSNFTNKMI